MERAWRNILARYGQPVTLSAGEGTVCVQALVQPLRDRDREQEIHGPLGLGRQDRFLYLGPGDCALGPGTEVERGGQRFRVLSANRMGEGVCPHWRAVLCTGEEAEQ